jgi:spore coat polysaccharide biosynthesis protein SpsF
MDRPASTCAPLKIVAITQARMTSTRLPGKVMLPVLGKPLLRWHLERVQRAATLDELVLAITTNPGDQVLADLAGGMGIPVFRGSEDDVLSRYYGAAREHGADVIVRVTSDCPLIDPAVIDSTVRAFLAAQPGVDYASNRLPQTYPRGMDTEVATMAALSEAMTEANAPLDREHVTLFIWRQTERYRAVNAPYHTDQSRHRWTVDVPEDFELIRRIIEMVAPMTPNFSLEDCLEVLGRFPAWEDLNRHVEQRKVV